MGTSSRFGPKNSCGGEIVEVQGGHIIRSIGRKDRHSQRAKGPPNRLGYDRPSKSVDWLIKKAKASIDELAELPPWKPTIGPTANYTFDQEKRQQQQDENVGIHCEEDAQLVDDNNSVAGPSSKRAMIMLDNENDARFFHQNNCASTSGENANASFLPPSLDSDAISDTIKCFFPMGGGSTEGNSSAMQFQSFQEHNLLSRISNQSQDLDLSLQSFQDPILLHHQNQQPQHHNHHSEQADSFFKQQTSLLEAFHLSVELGRMHRLAAARAGGDNSTGIPLGGGTVTAAGGFLFNTPPSEPLLQQLFGQNQFLSQRGPLQSSYSPSNRAWFDPSAIAIATVDLIHHHQYHQAVLPMYSASGIGLASEVGGFSGFRIPSRIQGEIEEHDGISDKPSSASSDSRR
ncbi:unnamed protein product [Withania somnifera]